MRALCLLLLAGCTPVHNYLDPNGPRYSGDYTAGAPQPDGDLLVVTYNLEFAQEVDRAIAVLRQPPYSELDVLVMQEMDSAAVDRVAQGLALRWVYYPGSRLHDGQDFGNAVLTRWPLVADRKLLLPHHDPYYDRARIAVVGEVECDGTLAQVASVHNTAPALGLGARLEQAKTILLDLEVHPEGGLRPDLLRHHPGWLRARPGVRRGRLHHQPVRPPVPGQHLLRHRARGRARVLGIGAVRRVRLAHVGVRDGERAGLLLPVDQRLLHDDDRRHRGRRGAVAAVERGARRQLERRRALRA